MWDDEKVLEVDGGDGCTTMNALNTLLLLLLSRFSRVRLCATPQTAAHQAPPSLGFSRQEHWSGLLSRQEKLKISQTYW